MTKKKKKTHKKPKAYTRYNGDILCLLGAAQEALRTHGMDKECARMKERVVKQSKTYQEAYSVVKEYVDVHYYTDLRSPRPRRKKT